MAKIIAARFETQPEADRALDALRCAGFDGQDVTSFYLNPPGAHAQYPIGGDTHHDEGTKHSGKTAAAGAAVGGVTWLALGTAVAAAGDVGLGAIAAVAGAGVGAYVGSLAGGLTGSHDGNPAKATKEEPVGRNAGVMIAVRVDADGAQNTVVGVMREQGGADIERAEGEWRDGEWVDFDPVAKPQPVDRI